MGRWLGVPVRLHLSLFLLLSLAVGYSAVATGSLGRGVALWLALLAAVLVREIARAIAAAYAGLPLRALVLLPIGGVMAMGPRQGNGPPQPHPRTLMIIGSVANLLVALLLLGFAYGVDPHVGLFRQPWITPKHILRSAVWLQVVVGLINLLPSATLPSRRSLPLPQRAPNAAQGAPARPPVRSLFGLGTAFALALMLSGLISGLLWPVLLGLTFLFTSYLSRATSAGSAEVMAADVREVMLTEYKPLSASSTLRDALRQTTHTAQELFPVLRGERLVGWISRSGLTSRLRTDGDGFLQGAMSRSFQAAAPEEKIGDALRRATSLGAGEFIPVVEDGAMIGLLTPVSLERAVGQLRLTQALVQRDAL